MPTGQPTPRGTLKIPMNVPPAGVFIAGPTVDAAHKFGYAPDSPGGASASLYRSTCTKAFVAGSLGADPPACPGPPAGLPAAGTPEATVYCALTCTRPWDTFFRPAPGATTAFAFAFGLATDPNGDLVITEDPSAGARSGRGTMWLVSFVP